MTALGYPLHFIVLLGVWKVLGALTLLAPGLRLVKEWAYAGIFIDLSGAVVASAANAGAAFHVIAPIVLIGILAASWALRPESRRLPGAKEGRPHRTRRPGRLCSTGSASPTPDVLEAKTLVPEPARIGPVALRCPTRNQFVKMEKALNSYVALAPPVDSISTPKSIWPSVELASQPCWMVQSMISSRFTVPEVNVTVDSRTMEVVRGPPHVVRPTAEGRRRHWVPAGTRW